MTRQITDAELEELGRLASGCGDSSCMWVRPTGMATNGGCRCLGERSMVKQRAHLLDILPALVAEVKRLRDALKAVAG